MDQLLQFNMDVRQEQQARENHRKILGKRMQTEPLNALADEFPEMMWDYAKLKNNIVQYKIDTVRNNLREKPTTIAPLEFMPKPMKDEDGD